MYVQCVDGLFYKNPRFSTALAVVKFDDDGVFLIRKGEVSWRTAVRELTALGIRARNQVAGDEGGLVDEIIGGVLTTATVFALKLIAPIPVPAGAGFKQAVGDEEILMFKVKKCKAS